VSETPPVLYAYEIHEYHRQDMKIIPAPIERRWMDESDQRFAYRCLPLVIANQAGWLIECPVGFTATWNGGRLMEDLRIVFDAAPGAAPAAAPTDGSFVIWAGDSTAAPGPADSRISSHFGDGILTFSLPYLFRTPRGINLWVKGPTNWIKDGVWPLEGVVESDWSPATFTMNWKLTRPHLPVRFERGEPMCMLVPVPRGLAESLMPRQASLRSNPELEADFDNWQRGRSEFLDKLTDLDPEVVSRGWQKDYFQGRAADGSRFADHQTRLGLKGFTRE
jgi:hypothetical protein